MSWSISIIYQILILIGIQDKKESVEKAVTTEETSKENSVQPKVFDIKEWNSSCMLLGSLQFYLLKYLWCTNMYMHVHVYKDVMYMYVYKHVHVCI